MFLGKPEQAKRTAPLFTASFLHHAVLTGNPQQTTKAPLVCAAKPLPGTGPWVFLSKGLSSPLLSLSINLLNLHGPPVPACSGPLEPTEVQVTFVLPRIWGVNSPGSVGLVQRRPLHSQNASWTEDERKRHLNCASTQVQATRICHLECCNLSPCFQFDTPTHVYFPSTAKRIF